MAERDTHPPLLEVSDLEVGFPRWGSWTKVVRGASWSIDRGEFVGLVGESGSGKSLTALSVLGLVQTPGAILAGSVRFEGRELTTLKDRDLRRIRGGEIGLVFQEPMTAMNPVFTIGSQISEAIRIHRGGSRREALREAARLLELVAMPSPERRLSDYPHQLSGGQRQRALIAMALAARPKLLIADEPTTALDVTIQAQILDLLLQLREELGLAVVLITHDLAVVAETCDRVLVMYAGEVVERAPVQGLFEQPAHPYTRGLLGAVPTLGQPAARGELPTIPGQVPSADALPDGCAFHPRCPDVMTDCRSTRPDAYPTGEGRTARCLLHRPEAS